MNRKEITLLTDYQRRFGSKHNDQPYRSGMDRQKLEKYFSKWGWETRFTPFSAVDFVNTDHCGRVYLYTSSEDQDYYYKDYIEDIVFGLELAGARMIPPFRYLRANNNKVMMEILREIVSASPMNHLRSWTFGTLEELAMVIKDLPFPCVLKTAAGASGKGVALAGNPRELIHKARRISRTRNLRFEARDRGRALKHPGYRRESLYRKKFIVQEFIPDLRNDWKVYVFGEKLYVFFRPILKGRGIKASGGGYGNYLYGKDAEVPQGLFDFARSIFSALNIPHVSLDIAFDGKNFFLLEFQALYFGTAGILNSEHYFQKEKGVWQSRNNSRDIEQVYVESIAQFLNHGD